MFCVFSFSVLFNAFNSREFGIDSIIPNFTKNTLAIKVISITAIAQIFCVEIFRSFFNSVPLEFSMWIKIIALGSTIVLVNEAVKYLLRIKLKHVSVDNKVAV